MCKWEIYIAEFKDHGFVKLVLNTARMTSVLWLMTDTDFSKTGRLGRPRCSPWIWDNLGEAIHWWEASGWKYANCSNFTKILLFGIFQNKWHRKTEKSLLLGWVLLLNSWVIVVKEARFQLLVSIVALNEWESCPVMWVTKCAALNMCSESHSASSEWR